MRCLPALPFLLLGLSACGLPSVEPDPAPEVNASLAITSPEAGATVVTGTEADRPVTVEFTVEGVTLAAPGSCLAKDGPCGHVRVTVDGAACNGEGSAFNAVAVASPARAALGRCALVEGQHEIRLSLVGDDGAPYTVDGTAVQARVSVSATVPPLLDRLGGEAGLEALAEAMMERQLEAPEINAYFRNASVNHAQVTACMAVMFQSMLGSAPEDGDCELDMAAAHEGLGISTADFDDWLIQYDAAAVDLGIGPEDAGEFRAMLGGLTGMIEDPDSDATLYQRLGRRPGIEYAVEHFVNHLLADPVVARYFLDANGLPDYSPTFSVCLTRLLGSLDGPFIYGEGYPYERWLEEAGRPCRSMADSHDQMTSAPPEENPIRGEEFLQVVGVLVDTLVYLEVPQSEIDLLAAAMNLPVLCDQILGDPTECAALFP